MPCPETINIELSDLFAMAAVLVSGLAALYARWAWKEAHRANELTLLEHRKAIYDAFYALKMHMTQCGQFASKDEVSKFYYPSCDAAIYFDEKLSKRISGYYSACLKVADMSGLQNRTEDEKSTMNENLNRSREWEPKIEKSISKIIGRPAESG